MGQSHAFKVLGRAEAPRRPVGLRVLDFKECYEAAPPELLQKQAGRCMDCGVPFCQYGCPLGNWIPVWNDLVYRDQLAEAAAHLLATNDFPEFTGRLCPAPCEAACVLAQPGSGQAGEAVTIEHIEKGIIEWAFARGLVRPRPPQRRSGARVAVVGSGPAGLTVAARLNALGHEVTVLERDDRIGGLLRYGIPDFKMDKAVLDRRLRLLEAEGVRFRSGVWVGRDVTLPELRRDHDAVCLCVGATVPRDVAELPGRGLSGVRFAMDYLTAENRRQAGLPVAAGEDLSARGKRVVILGGGDTGADCLGTAHRQGAASVLQLELLPRPEGRKDSLAHEEGGARDFAVLTTGFSGEGGALRRLHAVRLSPPPERRRGEELVFECELCLLAMGFLGPEADGLGGLLRDGRGNLATDERCMTAEPGVFAAGDARRGQSLVVWAIAEGRRAAQHIDAYLRGR